MFSPFKITAKLFDIPQGCEKIFSQIIARDFFTPHPL